MSKISKLTVDRNLCIGASSCLEIYPSVFALDDQKKAVMLKKNGPPTSDATGVSELSVDKIDDAELLFAAQSCPTRAIFLHDETGKQVYPEA